MPGISFTAEDIASGNKLDAAWYKLLVKSIVPGPGKKDPSSTTYTCEFVVDQDLGKGTPIRFWFSDKMPKVIIEYLQSGFVAKIEPGKDYPIEATVGKHVMGYCNWDMEQKANVIQSFKKV